MFHIHRVCSSHTSTSDLQDSGLKDFTIHCFCGNKKCNEHLGPEGGADEECKKCGTARLDEAGNPTNARAVVFDMEKRVQEMWRCPTTARLLNYPHERKGDPGRLDDSWDGTLLKDVLAEHVAESKYNLVWDFCSDGACLETTTKKSYTPITARCHNLGPHVRGQMTSVGLFALAGPGISLFGPLLKLSALTLFADKG
jgi:hypothetical protein